MDAQQSVMCGDIRVHRTGNSQGLVPTWFGRHRLRSKSFLYVGALTQRDSLPIPTRYQLLPRTKDWEVLGGAPRHIIVQTLFIKLRSIDWQL